MATAISFAQHYIECENCEENPAQFLCKTCSGHLCDACKAEHERRKITRNHEVIHLTSEKGDIMERLYCSKHRNEKLKCYCSPCQTPVCTHCLLETHNCHEVENLAIVYSRIQDELLKDKKEIELTLLPKYKEMLAKETEKEANISKRIDEVEKQIEDHTDNIIKRFTAIKENWVQDLRQEKEKAQKSVAKSKTEIERRIKALNEIKTQISNNLGARPGIIFFKATDDNSLYKMRRFPNAIEYKLGNFSPGDIDQITRDIDFGKVPTYNMRSLSQYGLLLSSHHDIFQKSNPFFRAFFLDEK
ncbi:E3 ubiquitin-protein ligase TRIM71-like [Ostrea edulis]|uniref:E3 ubiquitin-protein ligase TRIM71-like n=1 Tax=Ostrea edulis TaxID=37623 RepID=UPI0024AF3DF0|nr:E3 ubiquitin-protein ligase TRIM71-like [Ostrea edulis]